MKDGYVFSRGGVSMAGRHISRAFMKAGYDVMCDFADAANSYKGDIIVREAKEEFGVNALWHAGSPSELMNIQEAINHANAVFGKPLKIFINNDGVLDGMRLPELSEAQYKELIEMHFVSFLNCAKAAGEEMAKHGGGVMITVVALMPFPGTSPGFSFEIALYRAFTESLARSYEDKRVRFNTVISGKLEFPEDPLPPEGYKVEHQRHAVNFEDRPPMPKGDDPAEFLDMIVRIAESPKMNGQVFSLDIKF
ncbi:MAG: SDR family NAD(P)-dependent oxidoreductase [Oscillospiraceae bacterium]|jgi:NAD(P)-dependent dehydrogenase (short-subunit alcohol dehydrogenase family)